MEGATILCVNGGRPGIAAASPPSRRSTSNGRSAADWSSAGPRARRRIAAAGTPLPVGGWTGALPAWRRRRGISRGDVNRVQPEAYRIRLLAEERRIESTHVHGFD